MPPRLIFLQRCSVACRPPPEFPNRAARQVPARLPRVVPGEDLSLDRQARAGEFVYVLFHGVSVGEANEALMQWKTGERLRCSNPECRFEVVVLAVGARKKPEASLICHCGSPMKRMYEKPVVHRLKFSSSGD